MQWQYDLNTTTFEKKRKEKGSNFNESRLQRDSGCGTRACHGSVPPSFEVTVALYGLEELGIRRMKGELLENSWLPIQDASFNVEQWTLIFDEPSLNFRPASRCHLHIASHGKVGWVQERAVEHALLKSCRQRPV